MARHERILAHIILFGFLIADAWLFLMSQGRPYFQAVLVAVAVGFYVLWGAWLHMLEERLNQKILAEYILLGVLVVLLFYVQALL